LAKIAVTPDGGSTSPQARTIARGAGWSVSEVVCKLGPADHPYEERHSSVSIAIVAAGSFQYRSQSSRELMTPGSLLLGSAGQYFECSHEHGTGDRCISFSYAPEFLDRLGIEPPFRHLRGPRLRALSPLVARAFAALDRRADTAWEELVIELGARTAQLDCGFSQKPAAEGPGAAARIGRLLRTIEGNEVSPFDLCSLAREARLSPYHFLRTFQSLTGVTPHQYLLRLRLQRAAVRLRTEPTKVVDIALESGFGDISNFNRTFRAEFGVSPRGWRKFGN
jgi:AraC family transcriptional regulator